MGTTQYPTTTFTLGSVALGTSSTLLVAANPQRLFLEIQNQGGAAVYIRLDGTAATADKDSTRILPGDSWWGFVLPHTAVYGISASGTNDVHIDEGN